MIDAVFARLSPTLGPTLGLLKPLQDWWQEWNFRGYGNSTVAAHSDWLFFWIFLITAFFFFLLMGLMFYFMFAYRRRPGAVPVRSRSHDTFLELSWSVIPTILLVWMFFEGFWGYANQVVAPGHAPEIVVRASMWSWSVTYPNGAESQERVPLGADDVPVFVVPERMPINLRMHSADVIHSFWVPDFRVKFDVFPNRYTTMWFETTGIDPAKRKPLDRPVYNEQGSMVGREPWLDPSGQPYYYQDHWVFCAEYCGAMHSEMLAMIRVVPQEVFDQYMIDWAEPRGTMIEQGEVFYRSKGCSSCHTVDGRAGAGPTWKNLYGYERTFSNNVPPQIADADYIRESMLSPGAKVVQPFPNNMPSQQGVLSEHQIDALIAYIQSLSDRGPAAEAPSPDATPPVPPEGVHPASPRDAQPEIPPEAQNPPG
jgi:cytochrome c oxidase subunit II